LLKRDSDWKRDEKSLFAVVMASPVKQEGGGVNVVVRGPINNPVGVNMEELRRSDEGGVAEPCPEAGALSHKVNRISKLGRRSIITKQRLSAFKGIDHDTECGK
jgi:hypothetical protein